MQRFWEGEAGRFGPQRSQKQEKTLSKAGTKALPILREKPQETRKAARGSALPLDLGFWKARNALLLLPSAQGAHGKSGGEASNQPKGPGILIPNQGLQPGVKGRWECLFKALPLVPSMRLA